MRNTCVSLSRLYTFTICMLWVFLVGCGGEQPPVTAAKMPPQSHCRINNTVQNNGLQRPIVTYTLGDTTSAHSISFTMVTVPGGVAFFTETADSITRRVDATYDIAESELSWQVWKLVHDWATDSSHGANRYSFDGGEQGGGEDRCNASNRPAYSVHHPVTCVSWFDGVKFANALSEYCDLNPVYQINGTVMRNGTSAPTVDVSADGFRLPTSDEWELAARFRRYDNDGNITENGEFYPGNYASGATANSENALATKEVAWYNINSCGNIGCIDSALHTNPIRQKTPNALGLYDMSGNVWEWNFNADTPDQRRVFRGGSWASSNAFLEVGFSISGSPFNQSSGIGLRLVR